MISLNNVKLKNLKLYKDKGVYYLEAIYIHEDDAGIYETVVPKISLPVYGGMPMFVSEIGHRSIHKIDLGFGELTVCEKDGIACTTKTIEEKTQKMTISEIEKKLGYKIEIVSEKGE